VNRTATRTITLTGIKPTGELHLGNFAGAIGPMARLAAEPGRELLVFVADLHALNAHPEPAALRLRSRRIAAALLACGLDGEHVHVYRQSRVPAVAQLAGLLGNLAAKGLLNRAHAYKATVAANAAAGRDPDAGVNMGLFGYPVLMAADILALDAHEVPVGADQAQHLEIAVDLAQQFARTYGPGVLREPRAVLPEGVATIPGLDGRKMSKSYENVIPLMAGRAQIVKLVRRIVTDSRPPEAPKAPEGDTLVTLLRAFAEPEEVADVEARYRAGGIGYGEVKDRLADAIDARMAPARDRYEALLADPEALDDRLAAGEAVACARADAVLERAMDAMGL
jgi:tryptophanyl-tRNA synthetase